MMIDLSVANGKLNSPIGIVCFTVLRECLGLLHLYTGHLFSLEYGSCGNWTCFCGQLYDQCSECNVPDHHLGGLYGCLYRKERKISLSSTFTPSE